MKAVLLVSHGSRSPRTKKEILALVNALFQRLPGVIIEYAFLDIESPDIPEGIDKCVSQGAGEIIVALNFLNSGRHVNEDIPAIVAEAQKKHPGVKFAVTQPIGQHSQIPGLFIDLINDV
ncbi:MAG: CbiX/SirB N-terminal domain-containing protein [Candidatus Omnitrophica bacterium]|nr:CbiX/SirB N-terminal domain-containing protein [Candidatus Omnitrophota bacterium]MDE2009622.1 CbiX/SirB N-terminal domain-containing protein [Candidatus Omnitrophota bacterium]MDE2214450.1 CbiX/SirB N-terminal domain-containing protein [Candidatus Omnitrophota bacterium]MDE2231590.1 CbiX/SirB N-terminal domain-containing protein [Candidatus Omnitrophota bacterium]